MAYLFLLLFGLALYVRRANGFRIQNDKFWKARELRKRVHYTVGIMYLKKTRSISEYDVKREQSSIFLQK